MISREKPVKVIGIKAHPILGVGRGHPVRQMISSFDEEELPIRVEHAANVFGHLHTVLLLNNS